MEPHIRYIRSADGTKIATATLGSGPPLVIVPPLIVFSIEGMWSIPLARVHLERIAASHTVISFDPRGQGLSDRNIGDLSLDARVADIEAVFEGLRVASAFVVARSLAVPAGIAFTARYPERVRRLALLGGGPRGQDVQPDETRLAVQTLLDINWQLYCNVLALVDFGWTEEARQYGLMISNATTPDVARASLAAFAGYDANDLLTSIGCPTLFVYPSEDEVSTWFNTETLRGMASLVPNARLTRLRGSTAATLGYGSWSPELIDAVLQFFAEATNDNAVASEAPSGTAVILYADLVDSTALTEQLGDARFREQHRHLDIRLRTVIEEQAGTPVAGRTLGDGVIASFASARDAIAAAQALATTAAEFEMSLHLGIHAGDVLREDQNIWGGAVNIAARISGLSAPNEILVSATVRDLARTSAGVTFEDRGEYALKGINEPQRLFAVRR